MTEKELMGPTGFWLETLRKDEQPKREYLTLADAVAQLNCKLDDLLNEGVAKRLDLYAPVLREGLYAWPVTDRGIPHASLVGSIAGVEPVFRSVLRYGEYAVLLPADIKKIKIEQSVKPGGYICPELVLRHTTEWQQERQQAERTAVLAERMKGRAKSVAWILEHPPAADAGAVRLEMLRVDGRDLPRVKEQLAKSAAAEVSSDAAHSNPDQPSQKNEGRASPAENDSGLKTLEQQIRAIEAGADALNFKREAIKRGEKKKLLTWCLEHHPELFESTSKHGDSKFIEAWKAASDKDRIISENRDTYANRK
ncbi:hypothetical protein NQS38_00670 [Ralstonia pseudosolanacearum]|uniref:hypothetical protein n=1 Tax=Ralstonia pseudosolanacearum TaxID=1310165 RepID=UPI0013C34FF8|nr:hypothetical protein [Ralstonia pseudosolanacearum]UYR06904.1 hypothetical protein NQS38_00670 [Ralstonia pseudosolanacearum]